MITNEMILDAAKECGDWNGQTCEMNDVGLQAFAKRMYQLGLLDGAERCEQIFDDDEGGAYTCSVTLCQMAKEIE